MASAVQNLERLIAKLRDRQARAQQDRGAVLVGFTAKYAIWVHEAPGTLTGQPRPSGKGSYWGPSFHGPKYLERPAREMTNDGTLSGIIFKAMRAGKTLMQGVLLAGLRLQREAQLRVPVEYGNLRASAFTRVVKE